MKREKTLDEKVLEVTKKIINYKHSDRELYKSILNVLPKFKDSKGSYDPESVNLAIKAIDIFDALKEPSRKWSFSVHWLYTVCNPNITKIENVQYSPIYEEYATDFPNDHFKELTHLDDEETGLTPHGNKLVADSRFVDSGVWDFGSAWDNNGNVIKKDEYGHPIYDGYAGFLGNKITKIQEHFRKKNHLDRNFQGFLIAHTRDFQTVERNSGVEHKESHFHGVLDMPRPQSRYQIMSALGVNFDDFTNTFLWMSSDSPDFLNDRINSFLGSLQGLIKNFNIPDHYDASLKYLVHQSSGAKKDQKTPYDVKEVISWLPEGSPDSYSSIAGVYNNEIVKSDVNAEVIRNLNSPYNSKHHTSQWVSQLKDEKIFTVDELTELRSIGKKGMGKSDFSVKSKDLIINQIMKLIRSNRIEMTDVEVLIHAAFDDSDADSLLSNVQFNSKLKSIFDYEKKAIIKDSEYDRNMLTMFITSSTGGIGKTRLANELAKYYDKGRLPHKASAKDVGKTFDPYQHYEGELSSVIDEIDPTSIAWQQLKDLLDPHKVPELSSRFENQIPWNLHHTFLTNVYRDGISGYIREVLTRAPGVEELGYMVKINGEWFLKENDSSAVQSYLSQLSQILRRIPISVRLYRNGKKTQAVVSIINFKPSGNSISHYGYVHTESSSKLFPFVINEDLSQKELKYMVRTVANMINEIQLEANIVFECHPDILLDDADGFISDHCNLGIKFNGNMPYLRN